jgi:uncharacterized membrane protein
MSTFELYLILQMDSLRVLLGIPLAIGCILMLLALIAASDSHDEKLARKLYIYGIALFCSAMAVLCATPSSKTLAALYVLPPLINNEEVQGDFKEIYDLAVEGLKDQLLMKGGE